MKYVRRSLSSPSLSSLLFGVSRCRTLVGVVYLSGLVALVAMSAAAARASVAGVRVVTMTPAFDTLYWAIIVVVVLSTFVVPLAYALFNGGPALAFCIAVAPEFVVYAATGSLYLTPDLALGLVFGALASALALYATDYRVHGTLSPGTRPALDDVLLFATAATLVAAAALARLYVAGAASMTARTEPMGYAVVPALVLVGRCWVDRLRLD